MKFLRILIILLAAAGLTACYSLAEDITPPPDYVYTTPIPSAVPTEVMYFPLMPPNPDAGAAIFAEKCAPCHGEQGFGDGPKAAELPNPVAAIGDPELARQRTPEDWFRQVTLGNIDRYMPPFNSLTERQRWDVVAYAFSLSTPSGSLELGKSLFTENCAACHGLSGAGDGPSTAGLPSPPPSFTNLSMMAERSLDDLVFGLSHPDLPEFPEYKSQLGEADKLALATYVREFSYGIEAVAVEPEAPPAASGVTTDTVTPESGTTPEAAPATEPAAAGTGSVSGQVVNLSGGELPEGTVATLYGFDQFQQVMTRTAALEPDGSFLFDGVDMPDGRAFIVAVEYDGGSYSSDLAVAGPEPQDLVLQVSVYDSSSDTSVLTIDRLHIFFEFLSADTIRVAELILVTNPTQSVVQAETPGDPTIEIRLPEGAENIQFQEGTLGTQFVMTGDGFGDLRAVSPGVGSHQILFSFDLPYERRFELNQSVDMPVGALVVLLPDVGVELAGSAFTFDGSRDIDGQSFLLYTGGNFSAGDSLPIALSGMPEFGGVASAAASSSDLAIGMTALGVVLVGAGVWLYRRQRTGGEAEEPFTGEEPVPEHIFAMNEEDLMDAIIALDDRYKAGDLPEGAYLKQRGLLKQRLQEILGA